MAGLFNSRVVRRKELAERLGVSEVTVWRWENRGLLPPKRAFGPNTVGWLESELEAWWAEQGSIFGVQGTQEG